MPAGIDIISSKKILSYRKTESSLTRNRSAGS